MKIPAAGLLLSILFFAGGCGCGKNEPPAPEENLPTVVTNRNADQSYLQEMEEIRRKQNQQAQARAKVVMQMEQKVAAVKAKLPKGATDTAVRAELEKDPEWKALEKENENRIQKIQADLAEARMAVRARLAKEREALRAVSEGRAKAAEEEGRVK